MKVPITMMEYIDIYLYSFGYITGQFAELLNLDQNDETMLKLTL